MAIRTKDHSLQELLQAMNPQEIDILRHYLTAFGSRKEAEPLSLRLMDMLLKSKDPLSDAICSKKLYGKAKDNRYEKLKSRLKQKVLDSLINDINIERNKDWDDIELVTIKLRKKLAQYYFLSLSKPNQAMIQHLLDEIIQVAKKYESYQVLAEALKFQKYTVGFRKGATTYNLINQEIKKYELLQQSVNQANDLYYRMLLIQNFSSNVEKSKYRKYLKKNILILKQLYNNTKSSSVGYFFFLFERNFYGLENDYNAASETCFNLIEILTNNPAIFRKQRIGSAYLFLSQCKIELDENEDSLQYAKKGKLYFPVKSDNYLSALEIEFRANQSLQKIHDAFEITNDLIQNTQFTKASSLRQGIYHYYHACTLFQIKNYPACIKSFLTNSALSQDKTGWDFGLRYMIILSHIELEHYDLATNAVEALRKHIERSDREKPIRKRDRMIYQILRTLSEHSFNFKETLRIERTKLDKLESQVAHLKWERLGHELVRFEQWLLRKADSH